jgi:hypothetical protein
MHKLIHGDVCIKGSIVTWEENPDRRNKRTDPAKQDLPNAWVYKGGTKIHPLVANLFVVYFTAFFSVTKAISRRMVG